MIKKIYKATIEVMDNNQWLLVLSSGFDQKGTPVGPFASKEEAESILTGMLYATGQWVDLKKPTYHRWDYMKVTYTLIR